MQENHSEKKSRICGLKVKSVARLSPFFLSGVTKGDIITAIDGHEISDELDFHFYSAASDFEMEIVRKERQLKIRVERSEGSFSEIEFYENPINCCRNRCIFCFIDQMPKGLRRGLYIKDEDFKHSFLNGNYVTLSGAKQADLDKMAQIGLSPLFISVHVTDSAIRKKMLGIANAPDIMEQLRFLAADRIAFHTQIVLCPGYNDGDVLKNTIEDLFSFGETLLSIAVVPVGLTNHRKVPLQPVTCAVARDVIALVTGLSEIHLAQDKARRLFLADEFFIKAGETIPGRDYYEEYPQIGNGVGLIRQRLDEWKKYRRKFASLTITPVKKPKSHLVITSVSAKAYIEKMVSDAMKVHPLYPAVFTVESVKNRFFGEMVTVAGLMTAGDVIRTIKIAMKQASFDRVILPRIMFNYAGKTLDGFSPERISKAAGLPVVVAESVEEMLTSGIRGLNAGK